MTLLHFFRRRIGPENAAIADAPPPVRLRPQQWIDRSENRPSNPMTDDVSGSRAGAQRPATDQRADSPQQDSRQRRSAGNSRDLPANATTSIRRRMPDRQLPRETDPPEDTTP
jgi:hypothetical protein